MASSRVGRRDGQAPVSCRAPRFRCSSQCRCCRLARAAVARLREQVAPLQHQRNRLALNRSRLLIACATRPMLRSPRQAEHGESARGGLGFWTSAIRHVVVASCTLMTRWGMCYKVLSSSARAVLLSRKRLKRDAICTSRKSLEEAIPISLQPPSEWPFELLAPLRQDARHPARSNRISQSLFEKHETAPAAAIALRLDRR